MKFTSIGHFQGNAIKCRYKSLKLPKYWVLSMNLMIFPEFWVLSTNFKISFVYHSYKTRVKFFSVSNAFYAAMCNTLVQPILRQLQKRNFKWCRLYYWHTVVCTSILKHLSGSITSIFSIWVWLLQHLSETKTTILTRRRRMGV